MGTQAPCIVSEHAADGFDTVVILPFSDLSSAS